MSVDNIFYSLFALGFTRIWEINEGHIEYWVSKMKVIVFILIVATGFSVDIWETRMVGEHPCTVWALPVGLMRLI